MGPAMAGYFAFRAYVGVPVDAFRTQVSCALTVRDLSGADQNKDIYAKVDAWRHRCVEARASIHLATFMAW